MDGTRLWREGERGGEGERSSWRVTVDEEEEEEGSEGRRREARGGCKRRKVDDFFGVVETGGSGAEEEDGDAGSGRWWKPLGTMSRTRFSASQSAASGRCDSEVGNTDAVRE